LGTYQKVILTATVTKQPELRYTGDGTAFAPLSVVVNCGWGENKHPMWVRVSTWRKTAEFIAQYVGKGDIVTIDGELTPDKETGNPRIWTSNEGEARASYEVNARNVQLISSKKSASDSSEDTKNDEYTDETEIPF